jgi:peptidoglycan/LPS O-acetylase OafA/YrhL
MGAKSTPGLLAPRTGDYPELTSIRAIAALAVVATHSAFWTGHYVGDGGLIWARLDFGVALFFVLSGFLLFRSWVAAAARAEPAPRVRVYLRKRAIRILPGYWLTVVAAFVLVPSDIWAGFGAFVRSMTFTQVYGSNYQHRGLTQMWSLCVEVAFYLVLPIIAWFAVRICSAGRWRPRTVLVIVALIACISPAWYVLTREVVVLDISSIFWLPGYIDWFAVGMALAVLAVGLESETFTSPTLRAVASAPGACWLAAIALLIVATTPAAGTATLVPLPLFDALTKNILYAVAAGLMVAPIVLGGAGTTALGWLRWPPLLWLGGISYEIFLVHLIVVEGVLNVLGYATFSGSPGYVFVITAIVSIGIAWSLKSGIDHALMRLHLQPPSRHDRQRRNGQQPAHLDRPLQP